MDLAWLARAGYGINLRAKQLNVVKIREQAEAIRHLYETAGIALPTTSGLSHFIKKATHVAEKWESGSGDHMPAADVFASMHMFRLATAICSLEGHPKIAYYLSRLTRGDVDFFQREESEAKNIQIELRRPAVGK